MKKNEKKKNERMKNEEEETLRDAQNETAPRTGRSCDAGASCCL